MQSEILRSDPETYFHVRLTGDFSAQDFISAYTAVVTHPDYRAGTHIVWDAREASFAHLSQRDIVSFCLDMARAAVDRGGGKGACIVNRTVDFGMSRMFQTFAEGTLKVNFQIFFSIDDAVAWFGESR